MHRFCSLLQGCISSINALRCLCHSKPRSEEEEGQSHAIWNIHLLTLFGSTTPYGYFFDHHSALFVTASTSTVEIITLVKRRDDAVLEELCLVP